MMEEPSSPPTKRFKANDLSEFCDSVTKYETNADLNVTSGKSYHGNYGTRSSETVEQCSLSSQSSSTTMSGLDVDVTNKANENYAQLSLKVMNSGKSDPGHRSSPISNIDESLYFTSQESQSLLDCSSQDLNKSPLYCDHCLHNYKPKVNLKSRDKSKGRARKGRETVPDILLKNRAIVFCLECNEYLCVVCSKYHTNHTGYCEQGAGNKHHEKYLSTKIREILKEEGTDIGSELVKVEKLLVLDRIQIKHPKDRFKDLVVKAICVVNNGQNWVVADNFNKCVKIFDSRTNKMIRYVKLSSRPCGITEVPCDNESHFSLAVTVPLPDHQITIIDVGTSGASVTYVINVSYEYTSIHYLCENFVTFCEGSGKEKHVIHILSLSGEIINVIKLHDIPGINISEDSTFHLNVHKQSESIYISSLEDGVVIHMNINGIVLNIFESTDIHPSAICIDVHQFVYIASGSRPDPVRVYRLSQDFSHCAVFLEDGVHNFDDVQVMTWYNDTFYISHEVRTSLENTVSIIRHE